MKTNDDIYSELVSIKKLLILSLISYGVSSTDIAKSIGMSTSTLYKFIPKRLTKNSNVDGN